MFTWREENPGTRKIKKADHPSAIYFLYSVYMQNDAVLVLSARIFQLLSLGRTDPSIRDKPHKTAVGRSASNL